MKATKVGIDKVSKDFEAVDKEFVKAKKELKKLDKRRHELMVAINCDHDIETVGGAILMEYRCKLCGYTWYD